MDQNQQQGAGQQQQADPAQNFQIHIDDENRAGKYANAVSVHVNRNEVVLDFGYIQPGQARRIDIISRLNLNHDVAKSFMTLLQDAILDFQNRMKEFEAANKANQAGNPEMPNQA